MKHHPENHRFIKLQFQQNIVSLEAAASQNDHEREVNISFEEIPKQKKKIDKNVLKVYFAIAKFEKLRGETKIQNLFSFIESYSC